MINTTGVQLRLSGFKDPTNWDESWRVYASQLAYPVEDEQWYNIADVNKKVKELEQRVAKLEGKK